MSTRLAAAVAALCLLAGPGLAAAFPVYGPTRPAAVSDDVPPRALTARARLNLAAFARLLGHVRYFHPSDQAAAADWNAFAMAGVEQVEDARDATELAQRLQRLFQPLAPTIQVFSTRPPAPITGPAGVGRIRWRHEGLGGTDQPPYASSRVPVTGPPAPAPVIDLGGGVKARVAIELPVDPDGRTLPLVEAAPRVRASRPDGFVPAGFDRTTRLADVALLWSALEHFFPYFDVVGADWDAELDRALVRAATDTDDLAFRDSLRLMIAALRDGHGEVIYDGGPLGLLPVELDWIEGRLVVTAVDASQTDLRPGDVVRRLDGRRVEAIIADGERTTSGGPQLRLWRSVVRLPRRQPGQVVEALVERAGEAPRNVRLTARVRPDGPVARQRPDSITELKPGILYVDLTRATEPMRQAAEGRMAAARGLVFDLRGYPLGWVGFLSHLTDHEFHSPSFSLPVITEPGWRNVAYKDLSWTLAPEAPRYTRNVVFLTDASAISYAESVLGTVSINRLGDIVGAPSAGANGNVNYISLPGGYLVRFTGMRVVNPDGTVQHMGGVRPTVPAAPTIAGVRAGRDEVLERGLALVESRMEEQR